MVLGSRADYEPWASATSPLPRARPGRIAERLIGTIRREYLDHMMVFGEAHLRRILGKYAAYYNESRIHRSLNKDAPFHRAIERVGAITSQPVLGGLHYQYCRI
jgi:transposase InsO family protein